MVVTSFLCLLGLGFTSPVRNYGANGFCSDPKQHNYMEIRTKRSCVQNSLFKQGVLKGSLFGHIADIS
jgi:hypothetical protein